MGIVKTYKEIEKIKEGGRILTFILKKLKKSIRPGIEGNQLDQLAQKLILEKGAKPSFKNYQGYPHSICLSVNEEIVHGLPTSRKIKENDIVSLDVGVYFKGYHTDAAITVGIGKITEEAERLIKTAKKALYLAIEEAKAQNYIADISQAIENKIKNEGFFVVKSCTGHGIGKSLHELPSIPNFVEFDSQTNKIKKGLQLKEGMILAIEPMATTKNGESIVTSDGWTIVNQAGGLAAHFETTVLVTKNKGEVLVDID